MSRRSLAVAVVLVLGACAHHRDRPLDGSVVDALVAEGFDLSDEPIEAVSSFEDALELDYTRVDAHRGLIEAYFHLGRLPEIEDRYRQRLGATPDDPFAAYGLGLIRYAISTDHADEAIRLLSLAEVHLPGEPDFPYRQGLIFLEAERFLEAKQVLSRAVSLDSNEAKYRVPFALALFHIGEHARSVESLRGILQLSPSPKSIEKARAVADQITDPFRLVPSTARTRMDQAIEWLERADVPQNAIDLLREILQEYPEIPMVHALLGLAYQRIDSAGQALVHLRRSVELGATLAVPHLYLGNFYFSKDRREDARQSYLAAIERNPLYLEPHVMLARAAIERGDGPEGIRHLRAWALLSPKNPRPRLDLARVLSRAGDLDAAIHALTGALRIDPGNLEAHLSLGAVFVRRRSLAKAPTRRDSLEREARSHLEQVLERQPENTAALRLLEQLDG